MGLSGISKSTVSKLCKEIDERVNAFLDRPLAGEWPYLWLDATYLRQREGGRIVSVAAIIAVAANTEGRREIVGLHVGPSEAETFWSAFLKSMLRRGLRGVKLVISDAHEGLRKALATCFIGASWQRCKVHFLRSATASVPKQHAPAVLAVLKTIFLQPTPETARAAIEHALRVLEPTFPRVAALLRDAEADVLAYLAFPVEHWRSISSTNVLERLNAEIDRRAKVVGIFPNTAALLRLTTAVLVEQDDEWQDGRRHFSQQSMAQLLADAPALPTSHFLEDLAA
jgi:transposase-like protein